MTLIEECVHSLFMSEGLLASTSVISAKNLLSTDTLVSFLKCQYGSGSSDFNAEVVFYGTKFFTQSKTKSTVNS